MTPHFVTFQENKAPDGAILTGRQLWLKPFERLLDGNFHLSK